MHVVVEEILSGAAEIAAAAPSERKACRNQRQDRCGAGGPQCAPDRKMRLRHAECPMSAPATAAAGSGTFFGSAATAGFRRLAFDADDGEDQDGPQSIARGAIHA
jgi:hypothetical protein